VRPVRYVLETISSLFRVATFSRRRTCRVCEGSGVRWVTEAYAVPCTVCRGLGTES
jgi:DnaJ-class molecular chaperone